MISFFELYKRFPKNYILKYIMSVGETIVAESLEKENLDILDFLNLLSPKAQVLLERMAYRAQEITKQYFGKVIILYIPFYISNHCTNNCLYCGFRKDNNIQRKLLSYEEIEDNSKIIAKTGIKHLLLLTGEDRGKTPIEYLIKSIEILKKYFSFIGIEMFPMETEEYVKLKDAGVDGLTIYQETYDRDIYKKVHLSGKKADFNYRIDTPERGAKAAFNSINIGPLLGLGEPLIEAFYAGLHAYYLQKKYPNIEISLSVPRINRAEGASKKLYKVDDKVFVQIILAYRLFLHRAGITLSTRENPELRDNLIILGITRMSAGSLTSVGGYADKMQPEQFDIHDNRSVDEVVKMICSKGYEPVFKDWELIR